MIIQTGRSPMTMRAVLAWLLACASAACADAVVPEAPDDALIGPPLPMLTPTRAEIIKLGQPGVMSSERGLYNVLYSDLENFLGGVYQNGGASGSGAAAITRLTADDIHMTAAGNVSSLRFMIGNNSGGTVTCRPRLRFYKADAPGGAPGTLITGFTFSNVSLGPTNGMVFTADLNPPVAFPQDFWAGITFDAGGTGTPLATLAQLNAMGMGLFNPPTVGSSTTSVFRTTAAGSFLSNAPTGSVNSVGSLGWEFRVTVGACCFAAQPCAEMEELTCLATGGAYRGDGTSCAACVPADPFFQPPPVGQYHVLDQITAMDFQDATRVPRPSQQYAPPPVADPMNIAYLDEFTITTKTVITRVDAVITTTGGGVGELPPPNGFMLSIWPNVTAAVADPTLQFNTVYNQGYTVPVLLRGGGEYELSVVGVGSNPFGWSAVKLYINPAIASDAERSAPGLVLSPGTYHFAVMHRGPSGWSEGAVLDSNHQDPRFPANNAVQVNPSGLRIPGGTHQTGRPAAYRVLGRNCEGDINGDGLVNTNDLILMLAVFGTGQPPGRNGDFSGDGFIDINDLVVLLARFGGPCA